MLVVDLDGTLLTSAGELSWRDRRAIQDVRRSGISITLASARPPAGMRHIIEELGIGDVDVIAYSGALATLSRAGSGQHQVVDARMSPDVARSILERAIDAGIAGWW